MLGSDHWDRNASQRLLDLSPERFPTKAGRAPMADAVFDLPGQARSVLWTHPAGLQERLGWWRHGVHSHSREGCRWPTSFSQETMAMAPSHLGVRGFTRLLQ